MPSKTVLFPKSRSRMVQRVRTSPFLAAAVVFGVVAIGYVAVHSFAAGSFASLEPENGTLAGGAAAVSSSGASGGSAVKFGGAPTPAPTPTPGKLGWSTGYYVGWQQPAYPPSSLPWKAITHLNQFSIMTSSSRDGSVVLAHSLTAEYMTAAVAEAHKHNVKILISVGGAEDNNFDAACNSTNRSKFVTNVVNLMTQYGYDGVDMDDEQDFNHTDYVACIQALRSALDQVNPRPLLTMASDPDWQQTMAVLVYQYMDQINLMTYWTLAGNMGAQLNNYTSLGIPKSKIGLGFGLGDDGGIDTTATECDAKAKYSVDNGYGGAMEWIITDDQGLHGGQTPCLDAVTGYVPAH